MVRTSDQVAPGHLTLEVFQADEVLYISSGLGTALGSPKRGCGDMSGLPCLDACHVIAECLV